MIYWAVLLISCSLSHLIHGAPPLAPTQCIRFDISRVDDHPPQLTLETLGRPRYKVVLCDGLVGDTLIAIQPSNKGTIHLIFSSRNLSHWPTDAIETLVHSLHARRTHYIDYTCIKTSRKLCLELTIANVTTNADTYRSRRSVPMANGDLETKSMFIPGWLVAVVMAVVGVFLLSFVVALCVKSSPNEVSLTQKSELKVIDGPPKEYVDAGRKPSKSVSISEHHNNSNNTMTQEAKVRMENPVSPSPPLENADLLPITGGGAASQDPVQKHKKPSDPLPPAPSNAVPVIENKQDRNQENDDEEENPYDLADTAEDRDVQPSVDRDPPPPPLPGGSYAKVSRVSDHSTTTTTATNGSYAEISQVKPHAHVGRSRSSTEPVELPPLPPVTKHRAFSNTDQSTGFLAIPPGSGLEQQPLVLPFSTPDVVNEDKVYDSLEDDQDDMYESVPENLKEELIGGGNHSVPLPAPRSPMGVESGSPSPTKHPFTDSINQCPDSPNSKKSKKGGKKEDEQHKVKKKPLLNRFRSSSTSATAGKSRKEKDKKSEPALVSPDHTHFAQPIPPIPTNTSFDELEDEEDDDMYDSVDRDQVLMDVKLRSSTLPIGGGANLSSNSSTAGVRTSMHFSPRVAEPLPEVPEDSGSGSKDGAGLVQHDRFQEGDDPNYDVVTGAMKHGNQPYNEADDEEEDEGNYDTVKPQSERIDSAPDGRHHSYAKVSSSGQHQEQIGHDDLGYAIVDPSIVMRKRAESLTKTAAEQGKQGKEEPPYDKVKMEGNQDEDESPYEKVGHEEQNGDGTEKKGNVVDKKEPVVEGNGDRDEIDEPPYDRIQLEDGIDEPPYDKVKAQGDESEDLENTGTGYDKVKDKRGELDEPPYDKVRNMNTDEDVDGDGQSREEGSGDNGASTEDDPGYATVRVFDNDPVVPNPSVKMVEEHVEEVVITSPNMVIDFVMENVTPMDNSSPPVVGNEVYSQINLAEKHKLRKHKETSFDSNVDPIPAISSPQQSEDGSMSDVPPPLPSPFVGTPGTVTPDSCHDVEEQDPDYELLKQVDTPAEEANSIPENSEGTVNMVTNGDDSTLTSEQPNKLIETIEDRLLPPSTADNDHIYDSLDAEGEDKQIYDSLEPSDQQEPLSSTYDTLEGVQNQEELT